MARTPLRSKVVSDSYHALTTIVVTERAPRRRISALAKRVNVLVAPTDEAARAVRKAPRSKAGLRPHAAESSAHIDLPWLLAQLGRENVTGLLVEGGGEVNASFLMRGLAQRIVFFYAPRILGGRDSLKAVAGEGARSLADAVDLTDIQWRRLGVDWLLTARVSDGAAAPSPRRATRN